jgi:cardiolipin synthase
VATQQNRAENLVDGHRTLPVLLADLESAERNVHVAMFLFFDDPIANEIEAILEKKARAGVAVRVLLNVAKTRLGDPFSTGEEQMMEQDPSFHRDPTDVTAMQKRLKEAGVDLIDTDLDYDRIVNTGDPELDRLGQEIHDCISVDDLHIDHRKIVTIDGRVAYCGSANFGAQYLHHHAFDPEKEAHAEAKALLEANMPEPWWKWHDGYVRFEGPIAFDLDRVFRERWRLGGGGDFETLVQPARTPPRGEPIDSAVVVKNEPSARTNQVREAFCRCIAEAEHEIFIENPYVYHPRIVEALTAAKRAKPELRVTLILPALEWNDNEFAHDAQQHHYAAYLEAGIEVFEYQNHFTHLKLAVFDGKRALVGSANLNYRSLEDDKDFEANVLVEGRAFCERILREVRDVDLRVSHRIGESEVKGLSLHALRVRTRDPRTLAMIAAREL